MSGGEESKEEKQIKKMKAERKKKSKIYVLSIQVLFGIIIGISFTDYHNELVPFSLNFETIMILAAYSTVILSLVGYSIAIKNKFHMNGSRFILDVFLLYLYYQLVYSVQNSFEYFLWVFPFIFGTYVVWQLLEYLEWKDDEKSPYNRNKFLFTVILTIIITIIFLAIAFWYDTNGIIQNVTKEPNGILNYYPVTDIEKLILSGVLIMVFGFRIIMEYRGKLLKNS